MFQSARRFAPILALLLILVACVPIPPEAPGARPRSVATPPPRAPQAVAYNLGDATITQARFPEDSRFRNMPVRLNGMIAVPDEGDGPFPVVLILHGTHPGCPEIDHVDRWPCDPADERPNYRGFGYLAEHLAANGYVALSININAENTFGFGEPTPGERLQQLLDLHLQALAAAAAGGPNEFGVELNGRADVNRLTLFGHSRGGEGALVSANSPEMLTASRGYGPVAGVLLIAAATVTADPWSGSAVPLATILAACDGDVTTQDGQFFYEGARLAPQQSQWATSVWLERANHNHFNQILERDPFGTPGRPDCDAILEGDTQRRWLVDYAVDFLTTLFAQDPAAVRKAEARMGMDVNAPAPDALYALPARVAGLAPASDRRTIFRPSTAEELTSNLLGGSVTADGVATHFCPKGFYNPAMLPGSEPCRRTYVTIPGQPSHAVVSWDKPGAALRFAVPKGAGDLSGYAALSLRAAVDPVSALNADVKPQAFTVRLTDGRGNHARVSTRRDEPALTFPPGFVEPMAEGENIVFTGLVPLTTIRLALSDFTGIDLTDVREIALVFDRTPSGTLFMGDVEWVR